MAKPLASRRAPARAAMREPRRVRCGRSASTTASHGTRSRAPASRSRAIAAATARRPASRASSRSPRRASRSGPRRRSGGSVSRSACTTRGSRFEPTCGRQLARIVRRRAVRHQRLEHGAHRRPRAGAGVELAVRVRPGAALAEAVVRVGVDRQPAIRGRERAPPRLDVAPALEHRDVQAGRHAVERAEQSRRVRCRRRRRAARRRRRARTSAGTWRAAAEPPRPHPHVDDEPPAPRTRPCVERDASQPRLGEPVRRAAERCGGGGQQRRSRRVAGGSGDGGSWSTTSRGTAAFWRAPRGRASAGALTAEAGGRYVLLSMSPARILLLALCLASPALARRPHPAPCADGRFPLLRQPVARWRAAGDPGGARRRRGHRPAVRAAVPATLKATRRGTVVRASGRLPGHSRARAAEGTARRAPARPPRHAPRGRAAARSPREGYAQPVRRAARPAQPVAEVPPQRGAGRRAAPCARGRAADTCGPSRPARASSARRSSTATAPSTSAPPIARSTRSAPDGTRALAAPHRRDHRLGRAARRPRPRLRRLRRRHALRASTPRPARRCGRSPPTRRRRPAPSSTGSRATSRWAPTARSTCPNDNFFTYAIDRDTRRVRWRFRTADQTWSLPAVDAATRPPLHRQQHPAASARTPSPSTPRPARRLEAADDGTVAASPLLTADGTVVVGGFDGFVRCYDQATRRAVLDASARATTSTPAPRGCPTARSSSRRADGTVYALDPETGALRWPFDTRDADPLVARDRRRRQRLRRLRRGPAVRAEPRRHAALVDAAHRRPARRPERLAGARPRRDRDRRRERRGLQRPVRLLPAARGRRRRALPRAAGRGPARRRRLPLVDDAVRPRARTRRRRRSRPTSRSPSRSSCAAAATRSSRSSTRRRVQVALDPPAPVRVEVSGDRKFVTVDPAGAPRRPGRRPAAR